jgi:anti-sigma B factor antagonist
MELADLRVETVAQVVVAHLHGEIDLSNARELGEAISRHVSNEALGLVLDLTDIAYVDSAGIQVIYELRERLETRGQQIRLVVAPASPIADALRIADVLTAVRTDATLEAALHAIDA